jgi:ankyrin repeat protein
MIGNDQVRFCGHCHLQVHNLSQLTRSQAERLVARANGRLCVQYVRDPAGRPVTQPVRQKLHRIGRRVSRIAAGAFTATLSVTGAVAQSSGNSQSASLSPPPAMQISPRWALGSSVAGTITDQNGAVIPNATIALSNQELNLSLYASTGFDGQFRIEGLQAGAYKLRVEAPGFAGQQTEAIYVGANREACQDRTLQVAVIEELVNIEAGDEVGFSSGGGAMAFVAPADPFVRAAQEDNLEQLTSLIAGVDVNLRDKRTDTTALEHAVRNANREMVQLLLSSGADVNAKNDSGETVLMMLDKDATSDLVWDLLNAGADVNHKDDDGNTALMRIADTNLEALTTLIEAGAKVNAQNEEGLTALMQAAAEGAVNAVRALVLAGADINATAEDKRNALDRAAENDHLAVVRFLKSRGALPTGVQVEKE